MVTGPAPPPSEMIWRAAEKISESEVEEGRPRISADSQDTRPSITDCLGCLPRRWEESLERERLNLFRSRGEEEGGGGPDVSSSPTENCFERTRCIHSSGRDPEGEKNSSRTAGVLQSRMTSVLFPSRCLTTERPNSTPESLQTRVRRPEKRSEAKRDE